MTSPNTPSFAAETHEFLLGATSTQATNATTFADNMKLPVHRWYRYSAGYSAEWAGQLMRHWGVKRVLDPFGGSGTTCLAAQEQSVESIGVEVHPMVARTGPLLQDRPTPVGTAAQRLCWRRRIRKGPPVPHPGTVSRISSHEHPAARTVGARVKGGAAGSSAHKKVRVVLGSKSPARLATLKNAGVDPLVRVSDVNEDAVVAGLGDEDQAPASIVCALAEAKAVSVAQRLLDELEQKESQSASEADRMVVVGCDSMLEIDGRMVGKPELPEVAVERIKEMRGQDATLWTGHSLVLVERAPDSGWAASDPVTEVASTVVHFGQISDAEIDAYVATGEPLHVAGSFTIDGLGGPFIEGVTGDPHSVVGLSLPLMRRLIAQYGIFWPQLWS